MGHLVVARDLPVLIPREIVLPLPGANRNEISLDYVDVRRTANQTLISRSEIQRPDRKSEAGRSPAMK
jgi:hypothetical protein